MPRTTLPSLALVLLLAAAASWMAGCQTRRTHSDDIRPATYHPATDPFGGARLSTGSGYREDRSATPGHNSDYFATPKRP